MKYKQANIDYMPIHRIPHRVPRRFSIWLLMLVVAAFAGIFVFERSIGCGPVTYIGTFCWLVCIGFAQAWLFRPALRKP